MFHQFCPISKSQPINLKSVTRSSRDSRKLLKTCGTQGSPTQNSEWRCPPFGEDDKNTPTYPMQTSSPHPSTMCFFLGGFVLRVFVLLCPTRQKAHKNTHVQGGQPWFFAGSGRPDLDVSWKWWYPQNTPKWSCLVGKPMVVGHHRFRKHPFVVDFIFQILEFPRFLPDRGSPFWWSCGHGHSAGKIEIWWILLIFQGNVQTNIQE